MFTLLCALLAERVLGRDDCAGGNYWDWSNSNCKACPAGKYTLGERSYCDQCPSGKWTTAAEQTSCPDCGEGSYATYATACKPCPGGKYNDRAAYRSCKSCPSGKFSGDGASSCLACPGGRFEASSNRATCKLCPVGQMQTSNRKSCESCGVGASRAASSNDGCVGCTAGWYANACTKSVCSSKDDPDTMVAACSRCPVGKYSPGRDAALPACASIAHRRRFSSATMTIRRRFSESNCWNVLAQGAFRSKTYPGGAASVAYIGVVGGGMQCFACPAGHFAAEEGASGCTACPAGKYAAGVDLLTAQEAAAGATGCSTCPEATVTLGKGASSAADCVAAPCGIRFSREGHRTNAGPCPHSTPPELLPDTAANAVARRAFAPCCYQNTCSKLLCDVDPSAENTGTPALVSLRPAVLAADGTLEVRGFALSKFTQYTCVFKATASSFMLRVPASGDASLGVQHAHGAVKGGTVVRCVLPVGAWVIGPTTVRVTVEQDTAVEPSTGKPAICAGTYANMPFCTNFNLTLAPSTGLALDLASAWRGATLGGTEPVQTGSLGKLAAGARAGATAGSRVVRVLAAALELVEEGGKYACRWRAGGVVADSAVVAASSRSVLSCAVPEWSGAATAATLQLVRVPATAASVAAAGGAVEVVAFTATDNVTVSFTPSWQGVALQHAGLQEQAPQQQTPAIAGALLPSLRITAAALAAGSASVVLSLVSARGLSPQAWYRCRFEPLRRNNAGASAAPLYSAPQRATSFSALACVVPAWTVSNVAGTGVSPPSVATVSLQAVGGSHASAAQAAAAATALLGDAALDAMVPLPAVPLFVGGAGSDRVHFTPSWFTANVTRGAVVGSSGDAAALLPAAGNWVVTVHGAALAAFDTNSSGSSCGADSTAVGTCEDVSSYDALACRFTAAALGAAAYSITLPASRTAYGRATCGMAPTWLAPAGTVRFDLLLGGVVLPREDSAGTPQAAPMEFEIVESWSGISAAGAAGGSAATPIVSASGGLVIIGGAGFEDDAWQEYECAFTPTGNAALAPVRMPMQAASSVRCRLKEPVAFADCVILCQSPSALAWGGALGADPPYGAAVTVQLLRAGHAVPRAAPAVAAAPLATSATLTLLGAVSEARTAAGGRTGLAVGGFEVEVIALGLSALHNGAMYRCTFLGADGSNALARSPLPPRAATAIPYAGGAVAVHCAAPKWLRATQNVTVGLQRLAPKVASTLPQAAALFGPYNVSASQLESAVEGDWVAIGNAGMPITAGVATLTLLPAWSWPSDPRAAPQDSSLAVRVSGYGFVDSCKFGADSVSPVLAPQAGCAPYVCEWLASAADGSGGSEVSLTTGAVITVPLRSPAVVLSPTQLSCASPALWPHNNTHLSVFALRGGVEKGGLGSSMSSASAEVGERFVAPTAVVPAGSDAAKLFFTFTSLQVAAVTGCALNFYSDGQGVGGAASGASVGNATAGCSTRGGDVIAVHIRLGEQLANDTKFMSGWSVSVDGRVCTSTTAGADTNLRVTKQPGTASGSLGSLFALRCVLPRGTGFALHVRVEHSGQVGTSRLLSYAPPTVTAVRGCRSDGTGTRECKTAGGTLLTMTGEHFCSDDLQQKTSVSVSVGGTPCPVHAPNGTPRVNSTSVVCVLAPGQGGAAGTDGLNVTVTTAGQRSLSQLTLAQVQAALAAVADGTDEEELAIDLVPLVPLLKLRGGNGGTTNISVLQRAAMIAASAQPPPAVRFAAPGVTRVAGCAEQGVLTTALCPIGGAVSTQTTTLTVTGSNFGTSGAVVHLQPPSGMLGSSGNATTALLCGDVMHDSFEPHTMLTCTLPPLLQPNASATPVPFLGPYKVLVGQQSGAVSPVVDASVSFAEAPRIHSLSAPQCAGGSTCATGGGAVLTVSGDRFGYGMAQAWLRVRDQSTALSGAQKAAGRAALVLAQTKAAALVRATAAAAAAAAATGGFAPAATDATSTSAPAALPRDTWTPCLPAAATGSANTLLCVLPALARCCAGAIDVAALQYDQSDVVFSVGASALRFALPSVDAIEGCTLRGNSTVGCPVDGGVGTGTAITVTGANFGASGASVLFQVESSAVAVGNSAAAAAAGAFASAVADVYTSRQVSEAFVAGTTAETSWATSAPKVVYVSCTGVAHGATDGGARPHGTLRCTLPGGGGAELQPIVTSADDVQAAAKAGKQYVPITTTAQSVAATLSYAIPEILGLCGCGNANASACTAAAAAGHTASVGHTSAQNCATDASDARGTVRVWGRSLLPTTSAATAPERAFANWVAPRLLVAGAGGCLTEECLFPRDALSPPCTVISVGGSSGLQQVECKVPPGAGALHQVHLVVGLQLSLPSTAITLGYGAPVVETAFCGPERSVGCHSPLQDGFAMTVTGADFGVYAGGAQSTVLVGKAVCRVASADKWHHRLVVCSDAGAAGAGSNASVAIRSRGQTSTTVGAASTISFAMPQITQPPRFEGSSVAATTGGSNGTVVVLSGSNFGPASQPSAQQDAASVASAYSFADGWLALNHTSRLWFNTAQHAYGPVKCVQAACRGGYGDAVALKSAHVEGAAALALLGRANGTRCGELRCVMPRGAGRITSWLVEVGGQKMAAPFTTAGNTVLRYASPVIHSTKLLNSSNPLQSIAAAGCSGGDTLVLHGSSFGPHADVIAVSVGGLPCPVTELRSDSELTCRVPAGNGVGLPVTVTVAGTSDINVGVAAGAKAASAWPRLLLSYSGCPDGFVFEEAVGGCAPCPAGSAQRGSRFVPNCTACPVDTYAATKGLSVCKACPALTTTAGQTASSAVTACRCRAFTYSLFGLGTACQDCPNGAECFGGDQLPVAKAGFWITEDLCSSAAARAAAALTISGDTVQKGSKCVPLKCESEDACPGGANKACGTGYEGLMCGECSKNFYALPLQGHQCLPCPRMATLWLVLYFVVAAMLAGGAYLVSKKGPNLSALTIGVNFFQIYSMFGNFKLDWPHEVQRTFQFASLFRFEFSVVSPECSADMSYWWKFLVVQCLPLGMLVIYAVVFVFMYLGKRFVLHREGDESTSHRLSMLSAFVMTLDLLYITLTEKVIEIFDCSLNADGLYYIEAAPSIQCFTEEYNTWYRPFAVLFLIIHVIGIPTGFLTVLVRNRQDIMRDQYQKELAIATNSVRKKYSIIYKRYKPTRYYWAVMIQLREAAIVCSMLLFTDQVIFQALTIIWVLFVSLVMQRELNPYRTRDGADYESYQLFKHKARKRYLEAKYGHRWLAIWKDSQGPQKRASMVSHLKASRDAHVVYKSTKKEAKTTMMGDYVWKGRQLMAKAVSFATNYNHMESVYLVVSFHVVAAGILFHTTVYAPGSPKWMVLVGLCLSLLYLGVFYLAGLLLHESYKAMLAWEHERAVRARRKREARMETRKALARGARKRAATRARAATLAAEPATDGQVSSATSAAAAAESDGVQLSPNLMNVLWNDMRYGTCGLDVKTFASPIHGDGTDRASDFVGGEEDDSDDDDDMPADLVGMAPGKKWVWRDTSTRSNVPSRPMPMAALTTSGRLKTRVRKRGNSYMDPQALAAIMSRAESSVANDPLATHHSDEVAKLVQERAEQRANSRGDILAPNPMMSVRQAAGVGGDGNTSASPSSSGRDVTKGLGEGFSATRGGGSRASNATRTVSKSGGGSRSPSPDMRAHRSIGTGAGAGGRGHARRGSNSHAFAEAEAALGRQQLVAADGNWSPLEVLAGLVERRTLEESEQYERVRALEWLEQWVRESDVALKTIARSQALAVEPRGGAAGGASAPSSKAASLRDEVTTRSVLRRASESGLPPTPTPPPLSVTLNANGRKTGVVSNKHQKSPEQLLRRQARREVEEKIHSATRHAEARRMRAKVAKRMLRWLAAALCVAGVLAALGAITAELEAAGAAGAVAAAAVSGKSGAEARAAAAEAADVAAWEAVRPFLAAMGIAAVCVFWQIAVLILGVTCKQGKLAGGVRCWKHYRLVTELVMDALFSAAAVCVGAACWVSLVLEGSYSAGHLHPLFASVTGLRVLTVTTLVLGLLLGGCCAAGIQLLGDAEMHMELLYEAEEAQAASATKTAKRLCKKARDALRARRIAVVLSSQEGSVRAAQLLAAVACIGFGGAATALGGGSATPSESAATTAAALLLGTAFAVILRALVAVKHAMEDGARSQSHMRRAGRHEQTRARISPSIVGVLEAGWRVRTRTAASASTAGSQEVGGERGWRAPSKSMVCNSSLNTEMVGLPPSLSSASPMADIIPPITFQDGSSAVADVLLFALAATACALCMHTKEDSPRAAAAAAASTLLVTALLGPATQALVLGWSFASGSCRGTSCERAWRACTSRCGGSSFAGRLAAHKAGKQQRVTQDDDKESGVPGLQLMPMKARTDASEAQNPLDRGLRTRSAKRNTVKGAFLQKLKKTQKMAGVVPKSKAASAPLKVRSPLPLAQQTPSTPPPKVKPGVLSSASKDASTHVLMGLRGQKTEI